MRNVFDSINMENTGDDADDNQGPIDPHEVIEGLSPLLNAQGHIRSAEEVDVMADLMKDVKKLVSKCIYINIIKVTDDEKTLAKFIESDGWNTLHKWLDEAKAVDNQPLQVELLEAYREMPVTIEHLKINNCAKLIKQLSKTQNDEVRNLASDIVMKWMAKIREKGQSETNDAAADKAKKKSKKSKERSKDDLSKAKTHSSSDKESSRSNKHEARTITAMQVDNNNTTGLNTDVDDDSFTKPRPKTVKTVSTKFRSTGLLEQDTYPPSKKKRLADNTASAVRKNSVSKVPSPTEEKSLPALTVKIPSSTGNNVSNPSPTEENPRVKILTPTKIKVMPLHEIHESSGFMDAITSAPVSTTLRKKRKASSSTSQKTNTSPTLLTPPKQPAVPSFYKDTLDTSSESLKENDGARDNDMKDDTVSKDSDMKDNDDSSSVAGESESSCATDSGSRDSMKKKKRVSWAEESCMRQFYYFELDETERVNVNRIKDFAEIKKQEMMMERQMLENVKKHGMEKMGWRRPPLITGLPDTKSGMNSKEKDIQRQRELSVLQTIFFTKEMIPDMPAEPDYEPAEEPFNPKIIPLSEEGGSGILQDYSAPPVHHDNTPAALTLPPELVGLVASMSAQAPVENNTKEPPSTGTVAANVQRLLSSFMTGSQSQHPSNDELTVKLQQILEPVQGQMSDRDPNQPQQSHNMDPMSQPPPGYPQAGLLGSAPPGFPHMRPPPPMGPRGPGGGPPPPFRHRGPMPMMYHGGDEWRENMRGGPPCRPGMPPGMPRGPPCGPPMRGGPMMRGGPPRPRIPSGQGDRPICRNLATPSGCRFGNKCAFIHPGRNAPPL